MIPKDLTAVQVYFWPFSRYLTESWPVVVILFPVVQDSFSEISAEIE
jgi:hypothetical protein